MNDNELVSQIIWDYYYLNMMDGVKVKSKDPSTKVGAIITKNNKIVITGFNGFARGVQDNPLTHPERYERPLKYDYTIHAEMNAILLHARDGGVALDGSTMYASLHPCVPCANAIVEAGIKRVVGFCNYTEEEYLRLRETFKFDLSEQIFAEAGVEFVEYLPQAVEEYWKNHG